MDRPKLTLGTRSKSTKGPNLIKKARSSGSLQAGQQQPAEQEPMIPAFEDSTLTKNWTSIPGVVGPVFDQKGDICASVVLSRLLQAFHNRDKDIVSHHEFDMKDLVEYIKMKTGKPTIRNLNVAYDYIANQGLLKLGTRRAGRQRLRIKAHFDGRKDASRNDLYNKIEETPFGIALAITPKLVSCGKDIYRVPKYEKRDDKELGHAVLVVGKGRTREGEEFLVVQNSWGSNWGNEGYARISLLPEETFEIFWPSQ